jgi:hypothetical protein
MISKLTILFSGMIAADPWQGGATWAVLQYLLGFRRLGHEVLFVEPMARSSLRPAGISLEQSDNAAYFRSVMSDFGLAEHTALLLADTHETIGINYEDLIARAASADVLVNVSGMLTDPAITNRIPTRIYLDLDPAFVQLWHAVQKIDMRFGGHTHFVTVGQNLGRDGCTVPTCGRAWIPVAQPIVLEHWPVAQQITIDAMTTIGNWRGYGSIEHDGIHYGQKAHSFRELIDLPKLTAERFIPAISIHPGETKDLAALNENGWHLLDPAKVAATPHAYRQFIQGSKAEIGIAKSGYVASRCGWFSDRSVCYLASGRPVIAQETGFSRWLPTGAGLFSFSTRGEALAAIDAMNADYAHHSSAARRLAEQYFDSDRVLARLLREVGAMHE